jgi:hypothetical protein
MSRVVYLTSHHFEPHSHTLNGLTLHVQFEGGSAEVSMLDIPGIPEAEQPAGMRAAMLRLGEAISSGGEIPTRHTRTSSTLILRMVSSAASTIEPIGA